jgi:hypothetical protein
VVRPPNANCKVTLSQPVWHQTRSQLNLAHLMQRNQIDAYVRYEPGHGWPRPGRRAWPSTALKSNTPLVTRLSHRKSSTSPNSIPNPIHLFCTSHSLNTTYSQSFVSSLAWFN